MQQVAILEKLCRVCGRCVVTKQAPVCRQLKGQGDQKAPSTAFSIIFKLLVISEVGTPQVCNSHTVMDLQQCNGHVRMDAYQSATHR